MRAATPFGVCRESFQGHPCAALAVGDHGLCVVHAAGYRRNVSGANWSCATCGQPIRIGAWYQSRGEQTVHARCPTRRARRSERDA